MNSKIVIALSVLTIGVGSVVFGYYTTQSMKMDRSQFSKAKLKVVSYPAFISSFGPGPELAKRFKERTGVDVELVNGGDPSLIVQRLKSDPKLRADVLIGVDQLLAKRAKELQWKQLPKSFYDQIREDLLVFKGQNFVPIDWSPLTVIYRSKESEKSLKFSGAREFLKNLGNKSLALEDPRSSVLGRQWVYWFTQEKIEASYFSEAKPRLANSWSQAYGLFKRKSVDMVFSYLTSVIFHWEKEGDRSYHFAEFLGGHPFQVDGAGVLARCADCKSAFKFVEFLLEPENQALIMQKNFMFPAVKGVELSGAFSELPNLNLISYDQIDEFQVNINKNQSRFLDTLK